MAATPICDDRRDAFYSRWRLRRNCGDYNPVQAGETCQLQTIPCQPLDADGRFHETDLKPKIVTKRQEHFLLFVGQVPELPDAANESLESGKPTRFRVLPSMVHPALPLQCSPISLGAASHFFCKKFASGLSDPRIDESIFTVITL